MACINKKKCTRIIINYYFTFSLINIKHFDKNQYLKCMHIFVYYAYKLSLQFYNIPCIILKICLGKSKDYFCIKILVKSCYFLSKNETTYLPLSREFMRL